MVSESLDQNLLASERKKKNPPGTKEPEAQAPKSRLRRLLKTLAYTWIALASFFFFFLLKFPADSVLKNLVAQYSQASPYLIRTGEIKLKPLLRPHVEITKLNLSPKFPSGESKDWAIEQARIFPNLLSMIPWKGGAPQPSFDFSLDAFGTTMNGSATMGMNAEYAFDTKELNLARLEALRTSLPVDLKGVLSSVLAKINLPQSRLSRSSGVIEIQGKGLLLDPSSLELGSLKLPPMDLGNLALSARIQNGKLSFDRLLLGDATKDVEMIATGSIALRDPMDYSELDLQIRFKLSAKLLSSVPGLEGMIPIIAAKRPDGYYGTKISGPLLAPSMPTAWAE